MLSLPSSGSTRPGIGFVSLESRITVTGQVNDVVTGGVNPVVRVNGVEATVANGSFLVTVLPLVRGPNRLEAVAADAVGNVGSHGVTVRFQEVAGPRIALVSGNGQAGLVREALPLPLVIQVADDLGNPLTGRMATFRVTRNSGTLRAQPGSEPARLVQAPTDGRGRASVLLTLGDTSGEGNNRVVATVLGAAGEVEFRASALAASAEKILMVNGDNQRGVVQHPLPTPLEALVVDRDGNPLRDFPVTFSVVRGAGSLDGETSILKLTGSDGIARAALSLGPDPGINNNAVAASFEGLEGLPATFVASGLLLGPSGETRFRGVVLDNGQTPIPEALVTVEGSRVSATTDAEGQFLLENVPVGHIVLQIDPTASPRPETFPPLEFEVVTVAGETNILGQPVLIPDLDVENSRIVGGDEDVTLTMKGVEGLELTVFANSVTCPPGTPDRSPDGKQCRVTISQVHLDKVPMPPPNGTIFMPPAWTVQPAGVVFDPPARISIPNDGLPPGRIIDIFQFDHELNAFINVGKGTVAEGITSDPGFGITRAGWGGCGLPPPPTTTTAKPPTPDQCQRWDPDLNQFRPDPFQDGDACENAEPFFSFPLCKTKDVQVLIKDSCRGTCDSGECKDSPFGIKRIREGIEAALSKICLSECINNENALQATMTDGLEANTFIVECVDELTANPGACAETAVGSFKTTLSRRAMRRLVCGDLDTQILHELVHGPGNKPDELEPKACELNCFGTFVGPGITGSQCK